MSDAGEGRQRNGCFLRRDNNQTVTPAAEIVDGKLYVTHSGISVDEKMIYVKDGEYVEDGR